MTYCGLVDQFMQSFGRAIVVSNDAQFDGKSKSLTKQELEENSHDADDDFKKVGKDTPDMSFNSNISTQARLRLLVGRQRTRENLFKLKYFTFGVALYVTKYNF